MTGSRYDEMGDGLARKVEAELQSRIAGWLAEQILDPSAFDPDGSDDDRQCVNDVLIRLCGGPEEIEHELQRLEDEVRRQLRRHWTSVELIAGHLIKSGRVESDDILLVTE